MERWTYLRGLTYEYPLTYLTYFLQCSTASERVQTGKYSTAGEEQAKLHRILRYIEGGREGGVATSFVVRSFSYGRFSI